MSNEFTFKIGDEAVKTIIELRDQEPGDKQYALSVSYTHLTLPTRTRV